jgi:hypothetical protein
MNDKTQRGIRMAVKVAAVSIGAGAVIMAASATEADAAPKQTSTATDVPKLEQVKVDGWSCWGPTSRGPAAPPEQADDFLELIDEVPQ